jgi:Crp-like helix-turn-helix domain
VRFQSYRIDSHCIPLNSNDARIPIDRHGDVWIAYVHGSEIQAAGHGHRVKAKVIREAINSSVTLHRALLRYTHSFLNQTTRTAVAHGRSKIDERLTRWLLMAADRIDDEELLPTQEFLAMMLGVRRLGVTVALQELETKGLIRRRRGKIVIRDREILEKFSNGTYAKDDGL